MVASMQQLAMKKKEGEPLAKEKKEDEPKRAGTVLKRPASAMQEAEHKGQGESKGEKKLPAGWKAERRERASGKQSGVAYHVYRAPDGTLCRSWSEMQQYLKAK